MDLPMKAYNETSIYNFYTDNNNTYTAESLYEANASSTNSHSGSDYVCYFLTASPFNLPFDELFVVRVSAYNSYGLGLTSSINTTGA